MLLHLLSHSKQLCGKVYIERLGTAEKVNKGRLQRRCLDDITTPPLFSGQLGSAWGRWQHNSALLEQDKFSERLEVPKFILLFTELGWSAQPYSINFGSVVSLYRGIEPLQELKDLLAFQVRSVNWNRKSESGEKEERSVLRSFGLSVFWQNATYKSFEKKNFVRKRDKKIRPKTLITENT